MKEYFHAGQAMCAILWRLSVDEILPMEKWKDINQWLLNRGHRQYLSVLYQNLHPDKGLLLYG
jgi:hypothetical protein